MKPHRDWQLEVTKGAPPRHWVVLYQSGAEVERFWLTSTHAELIEEAT